MRKERQGTFQEEEKEPVINRIAQLALSYPSRSAAARAWGVNVNTLNSYYKREKDTPTPRDNLLLRIAESEGVSLEWLRTGRGESPIKHEKHEKRKSGNDRLIEILSFLTCDERQQLTEVLARKGIETVLYLLDENNIKFLQLPDDEKERLMALHEAKKGASEDSQEVSVK